MNYNFRIIIMNAIKNLLGISQSSLITKLMKSVPKAKGKNMGHLPVRIPNETGQADLLYLPSDSGYNYVLSYVDESRIADAVPLKTRKPKEVLEGFKKIFNRTKKQQEELGIREKLRPPDMLKIDAGSEFRGVVKQYFEDNGTYVRVGRVKRSKQQALAEYLNYLIGRTVFTEL